MSDILNHLPKSYSDLKTCLNIILWYLARVKIFLCGKNLISGKVIRVRHILVLCRCWPLHLGSLYASPLRGLRAKCGQVRATCALNSLYACQMRFECVKRVSGGLCALRKASCVRRMASCVPGWASGAPIAEKITSKQFLTSQNLLLWYVWLHKHVGQNFSF